MKYIKKFESVKYAKYAKYDGYGIFFYVPYSSVDLVLMCIDKMDISESYKKQAKDIATKIKSKYYGLYFGFYINTTNDTYHVEYYICREVNLYNKKDGFESFKNNPFVCYTYKGEIELEDWEIAANKYNI